MATLKDYFNGSKDALERFVKHHKIDVFIETGTGIGDTVEFVRHSIPGMKYSIEIIKEIADKAAHRFYSDHMVHIVNNTSIEGLKTIIVNPQKCNVLFFLDAHFPGADFGYAKYDSEKNKDKRIPLQKEIETIIKCRGKAVKNDCFIIDDLRIYEDGPYDAGNWDLRDKLGGDNIDFIYDAFAETHLIEKGYRWQGFIVLTPMK